MQGRKDDDSEIMYEWVEHLIGKHAATERSIQRWSNQQQ